MGQGATGPFPYSVSARKIKHSIGVITQSCRQRRRCTRARPRRDAASLARRLRSKKRRKVSRLISTPRLNMLPCVYLEPIDLVIFQEPSDLLAQVGKPHLGAGFVLRCVQRLSFPDIATQPCHWRDNWFTIGPVTPVLSY